MEKTNKRKALLEHRLNRLIEIKRHACNDNAAEFGRRIGVEGTYAVRMFWPLGTKGRKGLGPEMEGRVRSEFGLCPGWFDLPLGTALPDQHSLQQPRANDDYTRSLANEETRLLQAFRLADPLLRQSLMRQTEWILESLDTTSRLNGTDKPEPE